jgi:hypothetical protein
MVDVIVIESQIYREHDGFHSGILELVLIQLRYNRAGFSLRWNQ